MRDRWGNDKSIMYRVVAVLIMEEYQIQQCYHSVLLSIALLPRLLRILPRLLQRCPSFRSGRSRITHYSWCAVHGRCAGTTLFLSPNAGGRGGLRVGFRRNRAECLLIGLGATTFWGRDLVGIFVFIENSSKHRSFFIRGRVFISSPSLGNIGCFFVERRGEAIHVVPGTEGKCGELFVRAFSQKSTTVLQVHTSCGSINKPSGG